MIASFARPGRECQRYADGYRLVAGCIPYRYAGESNETLEVLMVTPHRRDGLMFPKGAWEENEEKEVAACREAYEEAGVEGDIMGFLGFWNFTSRRHRDDRSPEGFRRGHMFALLVTKELDSWPDKDVRQRRWVSVEEAKNLLKHEWMREALEKCVTVCLPRKSQNTLSESVDGCESVDGSEFQDSLSQLSDEALQKCETVCLPRKSQTILSESVDGSESFDGFESPDSLSQLSDEEPSEQSGFDDDDAPSCPTEENASCSSE